MQTSLLRYPKGDKIIRVNDSMVKACKGSACAAALISYFEDCHNYKMQSQEFMNDLAIEQGRTPVESSGWSYHTNAQLKRNLIIFNAETINIAIKLLEELEFISTDPPDNIKSLNSGNGKWVLLLTERINEYFDTLVETVKAGKRQLVFPKPKAPIPEKPKSETADNAEIVLNYRNTRRIAYFAAKGRKVQNQKLIFEDLSVVMDLLKRGYSIDQLCYAIEGLFANDWYMGNNDRATVYDSVRHIFKDATTVNKHIAYAEAHGIPFGIKQVSGAPDKSQYGAYHWKVAKIIAPHVLTDINERVLRAQLDNYCDRKIPLRTPLIAEHLENRCIEEAGMVIFAHQERIDRAIALLKEVYEEK